MHNITIKQFKSFFQDAPCVGIDDDFYIIEADITENHQPLLHPCRFDCFMVIYCRRGHIRLNVNLEEYELKSGMVFLNYPGNIIRINELVGSEKTDLSYVCALMSREFVSNLMLDVNKIFTKNQSFVECPSIELDDAQKGLLRDQMSVIVKHIMSDNPFRMECVRSMMASLFYFFTGVWAEKLAKKSDADGNVSSRSRTLVDQFIKLVAEYHTCYRNVGFYADKLCLTPKYLSRVIRDATGRSAPEWIDAYVILEAKNLLKYSGLAIKEIVYKLNFPNQSVFYKFFKSRTGLTPSEYRNS